MGLAATAYAQPEQMHGNMGGNMGDGHQGMQGGGHAMQHGAQDGHAMQHGAQGGKHQGGMKHGGQDRQAAHQLMTLEERTAMQEKMRTATPEERQKIAATTRAEMQKRAQEKGITLPEHRGQHGRAGMAHMTPEAMQQTQ